ncbi:MAG: enoyl-CoA hydratase/isomerase family protein, partial [Pseudomonadota bacterium]
MTDDILFDQIGGWGVVTLNRPKALNALTQAMCQALRPRLEAWADDPAVKGVIVKGEGERAFCDGGDIRWLHDTAK